VAAKESATNAAAGTQSLINAQGKCKLVFGWKIISETRMWTSGFVR